MSNTNPFSTLFNVFSENNPFAESCSWDKFTTANKQNTKAFSDAAKAISDGAQVFSRRQSEIFQRSAEEASKLFKNATLSSTKNPQENIAQQADFAKNSIESAISNSRELYEITTKYSSEASEIISKRVSDVLSKLAVNTNTPSKQSSSNKKSSSESSDSSSKPDNNSSSSESNSDSSASSEKSSSNKSGKKKSQVA